ncbi:MAG: hypothetical protein KF703_02770 [Actinobacteria bacterium]|nr:hypothetical protein [Actinomycetota bacterium]
MDSAARSALTWVGRLCLLAIPFVFISGLAWPQGIRALDPVLCPSGLSIDKVEDPGEGTISRITSYEVVCRSADRLTVVTGKVFAVMGGLFLLAVAAYLLRERITPAFRAPAQVPTRR